MPKKQNRNSEDDNQLGLDLDVAPASPSLPAPTRRQQPGRIERVRSRDKFEAEIVSKGGDEDCIENSSATAHRILYGESPRETYQRLSISTYDRDRLPADMQDLTQVNEEICTHRLRRHEVRSQEQRAVNDEIVEVVADQTQKNKNWFGHLFSS